MLSFKLNYEPASYNLCAIKQEQERQSKQSSIKSVSQLFLKFWFVIHCWLNLNLTNTEVVTVTNICDFLKEAQKDMKVQKRGNCLFLGWKSLSLCCDNIRIFHQLTILYQLFFNEICDRNDPQVVSQNVILKLQLWIMCFRYFLLMYNLSHLSG